MEITISDSSYESASQNILVVEATGAETCKVFNGGETPSELSSNLGTMVQLAHRWNSSVCRNHRTTKRNEPSTWQ
jgi:hypothetical protein